MKSLAQRRRSARPAPSPADHAARMARTWAGDRTRGAIAFGEARGGVAGGAGGASEARGQRLRIGGTEGAAPRTKETAKRKET